MARQLVYTSAPVGLTPGRSGFCTVARHRDLRDRLVSRIEAYSSYPADWRPPPVIYAFRWIDLAGSRYAVLSRLVESGHDYTHRTNFLAHHLVLDADEAATAPRPADIILQWPGWHNRWDGPPQWLEDRDLVDVSRLTPAAPALPAKTWQEIAGHGGRAALLVDGASGAARRILRHSLAQEESMLRLFRESSALLSPGEAWSTEFITCLQPSDSPADFAWVGVRANSPADTPRTSSIVLDLAAPHSLPAAPDNALARAASAGGDAPSSPRTGMLGKFAERSSYPQEPVTERFSRRAPSADEAPETGGKVVWVATGVIVAVCMVALVWLLLFRDTDPHLKMVNAPNATVTTPVPPSPAELLSQPAAPAVDTLALERSWNEIVQLTQNGRFQEALARWTELEKAAPQFLALHVNFLKSRLLPDAQKDWQARLAQIVTKLNEGKSDRADLAAQFEALREFPHAWPTNDSAEMERAWNSTAQIFKLLNSLPSTPVWLVDDLTLSGAGAGYQDWTGTVAIPDLQALLATGELKARFACAPATSLALPLRGEWFEFDTQPGDHSRGDYLILHDSTRGTAGGRFLQFFSEAGGKIRISWRVFEENTDFFQRAPANAPLKNAAGQLWLRVTAEAPLPSFYLLLRRSAKDLPAPPWKPVIASMSWLTVEGAPADVKLPPWLAANLPLALRPGQSVRLEPKKGLAGVTESYDNAQAKDAATPATVHYQSSWLLNVLDQQIRARQTALLQAREQASQLPASADSPLNEQARQAVEKINQDLLQLQNARAAVAAAGWPRTVAPWRLTQLSNSTPPFTLLEFQSNETGSPP